MKQKTYAIPILLVVLIVLAGVAVARGGSIYLKAERSHRSPDLYEDDKASGVGDVLTIRIDEESKIDTKRKRDSEATTTDEGKIGGSFDLGDLLPSGWIDKGGVTLPTADYNGEVKTGVGGKADVSDEQSYEDNITVVVEDVMPNGNLLVLGKRTRQVGNNKQIVQASGIVRPSDIDGTNIVRSDRVANFHIVYINRGPNNNFMRSGWMYRIWQLLRPF
jgi:flagellar L-ring protein precursor FlgH